MTRPADVQSEIWRWLPTLRVIADNGGVSRAAAALGSSPAAVSRALTRIENAVGQRLFDRHGARLVLNSNGERLLAVFRESEAQLGALLKDLTDNDSAGTARLGFTGQFGRILLAPV